MAAYQAVLILGVLVLASGAAVSGVGLEDAWAVVGLAVVAALAERGRVRLGENIEASISLIPTVFAAAMFGPLAAMFVAIASFAGEFPLFLPNARKGAVLTRGAPIFGGVSTRASEPFPVGLQVSPLSAQPRTSGRAPPVWRWPRSSRPLLQRDSTSRLRH